MMKFVLVFILVISSHLFAQTDWVKWGKADYSYQVKDKNEYRDYKIDNTNLGSGALKLFTDGYWFFLSDVDGDNCPFSPTCSSFFLKSVHKTNIFQGSLMFFDRFTRDMNIYKKNDRYPLAINMHFYDPPSLYTLKTRNIKYIPPHVIVNNE